MVTSVSSYAAIHSTFAAVLPYPIVSIGLSVPTVDVVRRNHAFAFRETQTSLGTRHSKEKSKLLLFSV